MSLACTRPRAGALVIPFVVDESRDPIDFKVMDLRHVDLCAKEGRCGICGHKVRQGPIAFIGPDDGRSCFADPWMHLDCAQLAMRQCPFLAARRGWRNRDPEPLTEAYERNMVLSTATGWTSHRDALRHWHFRATHGLERA